MKTNKRRIQIAAALGVGALLAAPTTFAAYSVSAGGSGSALSASQLVDLLIPANSGITVVSGSESFSALSWHNTQGSKTAGSITSVEATAVGSFQGATANNGLPFSSGVVLSTGSLGGIGDNYEPEGTGTLPPNHSPRSSISWFRPGSQLLSDVTGIPMGSGSNTGLRDASWLSFAFSSSTDTFSFQYMFASDEYGSGEDEQIGSDAFAFVLTDLTTNQRINLSTINGNMISVSTVNAGSNSAYYTDNPVGDFEDPTDSPYQLEYDGLVGGVGALPLYATAQIIAGHNYRIDIVIADSGDRLGDSAVFLAADSFVSEPPPNPVPEPATYLGALALGALVASRLRRK